MGKSQHKESRRTCPACGLEKLFPARNETCSPQCAQKLKDVQAGEQHTYRGDEWTISLPKTRIKTVEELIAHAKVDTSVWDVKEFQLNSWEMGSLDKDKNPQVTGLFQVKAWLVKNRTRIAIQEEIAALKEDANRVIVPQKAPAIIRPAKSGVMAEYSIPDLHNGKLAWAQETGYSDYDSHISEDLHDAAMDALADRTRVHKLEQIVYVAGNDLMNADNAQMTTTRGTQQHNDTRYQKTFRSTRIMLCERILKLRKIAPVRVVIVPGNHDTLSAWCLGDSLECFFHGAQGVVVDNAPRKRKYLQWGSVMLMWTHGDKGKHDKYPLLMATEQREMFGATTWREIHLGHLHQVQLREQNGIRVRILPSLCAADAWHSEMGYVGNIRSAEAYIWHKQEGLLGTAIYAPPDYDARVPVAA